MMVNTSRTVAVAIRYECPLCGSEPGVYCDPAPSLHPNDSAHFERYLLALVEDKFKELEKR